MAWQVSVLESFNIGPEFVSQQWDVAVHKSTTPPSEIWYNIIVSAATHAQRYTGTLNPHTHRHTNTQTQILI